MARFSKLSKARFLCAAILGSLPTFASAVDLAPDLASQQWKLSPYLVGSTDKIRDLINGPLEAALNRKAFRLQQLRDCEANTDRKAEKLIKDSADYTQLQADLSSAQAKMATAHDQGDAVTLINSQNQIDTDKLKLRMLKTSIIENDPRFEGDRKQAEELAQDVHDGEPAVTNAAKARDQLMTGLRTALRLMGPPATGCKGILDRVKPTKIVDGNSFVCDYDAFEIEGEAKDAKVADGFTALSAISHPVHLLVTGYDTTKLRVGVGVQMDQTFQITGAQAVGRQSCYVVAPNETDPHDKRFGELLGVLDALRVPDSVKGNY